MKILSIAIKDLLITLKDKKALALITLMPIVLILVLGMCLSSAFNQGSDYSIKKFPVAIANMDKGEYAKNIIDFFSSDDIKEMIDLKEVDESEAIDRVRKGEFPAAVIIPEGYSKAVEEGRETELKVFKDPGSSLRSQIVESLVKSYTGVSSAIQGAMDASVTVFKNYNLDGRMIAQGIVDTVNSGDSEKTEFKESGLKRTETLSSIQYYSAAMLVMYILFVGMIGVSSIMEEREQKTLQRLMSTEVTKAQILSGKLLGLFILGVFDVSVLIIFTKYVFKVSWGNSILGLVILSAAMIFAASGLAMLIASVFKTSKAVDSFTPILIMVISFLGGSMFPIMSMPPILQSLGSITLNSWALKGYLALMMNSGIGAIVTPVIVLCAMGIVFLGTGIARLRLE